MIFVDLGAVQPEHVVGFADHTSLLEPPPDLGSMRRS